MENVVHLPTKGEQIAKKIRADIEGMKKSEADWAAYVIDLCEQVAEARALYPSNQEFGAWWDAQGFGLNKNDRAALIAMGENIEAARACLAVTERRSLQYIYEKEFKTSSLCKEDGSSPIPLSLSAKPRPPKKPTKIASAAKQVIDQLDTGQINDIPNGGQIAKEFGLHTREGTFAADQVRAVLDDRETRPPVTRAELSEGAQSKLDRAIKAEVKRLQSEFAQAVHEQSKKDADEFIKSMHPDWRRKIDFANSFKASREGAYPFTRDEFKKILTCLHPDRIQDEALKARFADAFGVFKSKEPLLVMPEPPTGGPDFPHSADALIKRRK
jgi:hypothetical protein